MALFARLRMLSPAPTNHHPYSYLPWVSTYAPRYLLTLLLLLLLLLLLHYYYYYHHYTLYRFEISCICAALFFSFLSAFSCCDSIYTSSTRGLPASYIHCLYLLRIILGIGYWVLGMYVRMGGKGWLADWLTLTVWWSSCWEVAEWIDGMMEGDGG